MKCLRIYYAHAICLYDTEEEKKEVILIREKFKNAEIINPADFPNSKMEFYLRLIDKCNIVIFSCLLEKITSGVGKEVNYALNKGKEVYLLKEVNLLPITSPVKFISRQSTRELYQKWWKDQE